MPSSGPPTPPLPTRRGVGPSCVALPPGDWPTIADFLVHRFPAVAASVWTARMEAGEVVDEHGAVVTATRQHAPSLRVFYYRSSTPQARLPFDEIVLFRDEHIVVADKPHFMAVTPAGRHLDDTLLVRLKHRLGIETLAPVHRIDRETAGLVLFTVQPATRGVYQQLFARHEVEKRYECIAPWRGDLEWPLYRDSRLIDDPSHFMRVVETPGDPNASSRIEWVRREGMWATYRLVPVTGRRHQLRVHCAALGIPIAGDRIYPRLLPPDTDDHDDPLRLVARMLSFVDPLDGSIRRFESERTLAPVAADRAIPTHQ